MSAPSACLQATFLTRKGNRPHERTVPCGIRDLLVNERQHRVDGGVVHAEAAYARADGVVVRLELNADDELAVAAEVCGQIDGRAEGGGQRGGRARIAQRVQIRIDGERFAVDRNLAAVERVGHGHGAVLDGHGHGAHGVLVGGDHRVGVYAVHGGIDRRHAVPVLAADKVATPVPAAATGKKIAIVGCGPAGLTAAYYLAQKGHDVEIFDEREHPGGVMRYGIPNYRLPDYKLYAEIDVIRALGVKIHLGYTVRQAREFQDKGYDATLLATGMQNSKRLGVPGDDQDFVIGGMDFLSAVRSGKNPRVGPHVIVIGGGNAAIDVAMTAFRQGAEKVQMWYRRNRKQMPANPHEVELALAEGVELVEFWAPTRIFPDKRIEFERSRYAPDAKTTPPVTVRADHIFAGIGQEADLSWLDGTKIETKWGNIVCDPVTLQTGEPGIFAGGDIAHGASTVVAAIGSGKRAAESIHSWLMGVPADFESLEPQRRDQVPFLPSTPQQRTSAERAHIEENDPSTRKFSHEFMQKDWDEKVAAVEAERCLRCDVCIGCGLCELACIEVGAEALKMVETKGGRMVFKDFTTPAEKCIGCGACTSVCPTGAIIVEDRDGYRVTEITGTVVRKQPLQVCSCCGETFSASTTQYLKTRDELGKKVLEENLCPSCARLKSAKSMKDMQWMAQMF